MPGLLIIVALFAVMWFVMIRPQRAKAQQQQRMLGTVAVGDEILTVGGLYGIVQELESEDDGGDLIVEIAEGIHVRIARRALATVVKPDEGDDDDEDEDDESDDTEGGDDEAASSAGEAAGPAGGAAVNGEEETVKPGRPDEPAAPAHS